MNSRKITDGDIADKRVASLPTRPTAPMAFGGKGYTPTELKEAFDKLKDYIEYMHIKDALATDGTVVPAGKGDGNLKYILESLFQNGYDGFLSLEPHLGTFEGLADLEIDDKMENLPKGGEGTFTVAYNALNRLLNQI